MSRRTMFTTFTTPVSLKRVAWRGSLLTMVISLLAFTIALAASGDLDTTFSGDGLVATDFFGGNNIPNDIAIQSNGKIVVVGWSTMPSTDFALTRYNTGGSLDITFSGDGRLTTNFGGVDAAYDVAVQADGKIIAVGSTCSSTTGICNIALARYNPGGALDTTFSGDGKQVADFGGGDNGTYGGLAIQPDGKIVVAGYMYNGANYDFAVYRYNTNGTLDTTFSGDGKVKIGFGTGRRDYAYGLGFQSTDGKIVVVGYTADVNFDTGNFALVRLNPNGTLDNTFSGDGRQSTDFGGDDFGYGFGGYADGRMVVVGYKDVGSLSYFAIARYHPDGSLDTTFNGTGRKSFSIIPGELSWAYDAVIQVDGKIVVGGVTDKDNFSTLTDFALVRLNPGGGLDTSFSGDGKVIIDFGGADSGNALARQPLDGKYVLVGYNDNGSQTDFALARVLP